MREVIPHCPVHADVPLVPRRRGWECPVCRNKVLSFREWPRPEVPSEQPAEGERQHRQLPWLVASPLVRCRDEPLSPVVRRELTATAAFATLRLAVALMLAEARHVGDGDRELAAALGGLALPGWRPWLDLGELLARRARSRSTLFPHLAAGWALLAATGSLQLLRGASRRRAGSEEGEDLDPATVERLAATLFGGEGVRLVRVLDRDPARAVSLHGAWPGEPCSPEDLAAAGELPNSCSVLALGERWLLPLEPFVISGPVSTDPDGTLAGEPALLLVMATEEGGFYQGLAHRHRHEVAWNEPSGWPAQGARRPAGALSRQQAADSAAALARQRTRQVREQPWHRGPLCPRPEIEAPLCAALGQPGRAVIVGGEAGCGKTVLLASLAMHLLGEAPGAERSSHLAALVTGSAAEPDVVALASGAGVWSREPGETASRTLARVVAAALGVPGDDSPRLATLIARLGASAALDRKLGRKVWLLLDGVDESEDGAALLGAIDSALPCLVTYPWLRLVLTLDVVTCRRLASPPDGSGLRLENERLVHTFAGGADGVLRRWLQLGPLPSEAATETVFGGRQQADPGRSCPLPLALLAASTRLALSHPLRLHLFHDSQHWVATGPADLDLHVMMAGWWVRRAEALGLPIGELASRMWSARTPGLTLAQVWRWWDEWCSGEGERTAAGAAAPCPPETLIEDRVLVVPGSGLSWPPRGDTLLAPVHVVASEALLWLGARSELAGRALPSGRELGSWIEGDAGRGSLRHELACLLAGLASRLLAVGEHRVLDVLLHAGDRELAAWVLSGALPAAARSEIVREHWLAAATGGVEVARRLARACVIAGIEPAAEVALVGFLHRVHAALVHHLPDEPAPRLLRARAASTRACLAGGPWLALPLLREARDDLRAIRRRWPACPGVAETLLTVLLPLGEITAVAGFAGEAEDALRETLLLARAGLAEEPARADLRRTLAEALVTLAELALASRRSVEAERLLREATTLASQLRARDPSGAGTRRLWGRVLLASGRAAVGQHRLPQAWTLSEEAVATLRTLAEAARAVVARIEYARAALAFAALAMEEQQERVARGTLDEAARVLDEPPPGCDDPVHELCRAELAVGQAALARDAEMRGEHLHRARRLLEPLVAAAVDLPRLAPLWREATLRLGEAEGERKHDEATHPAGGGAGKLSSS